MKNERQPASMRTITRVVALVALAAFAVGCATYQVPPPEPVAEPEVAGVYRTQYIVDGETVEVEVVLFPDGTFHEVATYETEAQPFSDVGVYRYLPETMEIEFFYDLPDSTANFTAITDPDFGAFSVEQDTFRKVFDGEELLASVPSVEDVAGTWVLAYHDDEEWVYLVMTVETDGTFVERVITPETEEVYTERGTFAFRADTGMAAFMYDEWQEGNFTGRFGSDGIALYTIDGRMERVHPSGTVGGRMIPNFVMRFVE